MGTSLLLLSRQQGEGSPLGAHVLEKPTALASLDECPHADPMTRSISCDCWASVSQGYRAETLGHGHRWVVCKPLLHTLGWFSLSVMLPTPTVAPAMVFLPQFVEIAVSFHCQCALEVRVEMDCGSFSLHALVYVICSPVLRHCYPCSTVLLGCFLLWVSPSNA